MKLILLFISVMLHSDTTTDVSDYMNVRTYETQNNIEYSSRVILFNTINSRVVLILKQQYNPLDNEISKNFVLLKWKYYF